MNACLRRRCASLMVLVVMMILSASVFSQTKRGITETDLFKFNWIADPQISPDGARVVFTKVWVNQKADRYDTALWIVPTNGGAARQLTAGPRDGTPRWSPDGKQLAFIRSAEKEGKPQPPQIYLMSLDGGEAQLRKERGNPVPPGAEPVHLVRSDFQPRVPTVVPDPQIAADAETSEIRLALLHLAESLRGNLQPIQHAAR